MHIAAPNYTQTPNVCFDEIFKTLKEGELRVILVLIRQTFGWHKPIDRISLGQLADKSGMERKSVCRSLNSLITKGLVTKKKFGNKGKERCYFSLVMSDPIEQEIPGDDDISEEEMELLSNNSYQCPKDTRPVSQGHYPQCPKDTTPSVLKTPTKETNTKETIQKKQQQAKPVSAAVSSKFSKKEEHKIYPILQSVDIPVHDKVEITSKHTIDEVTYAVKWATHPKTKLNKTLAAAIKWACKYKPSMPEEITDNKLPNKAYALKYNGSTSGRSKVEVCNKYVEITQEGSCYSFCLEYDVKGFIDQFKNALRKHKFKILED